MNILTVVSRSDAFASLWAQLASEHRLELRLIRAPDELPAPAERLAVVLSVAGAEEEAEALLRSLVAAGSDSTLIVGTEPDHRLAVSLLQAGAEDYFALPQDGELLRARIAAGVRHVEQLRARDRLVRSERASFDFGRILGRSDRLRAALDRTARIIPHDRATVLVTGETGTGKELLAQAIHYNGPRASGPFVEVNCAAIPPTLLESELFGHEKGAFTDARTAKPGLFEAAHGGTLFLDEIGHLPYELQGKILKAIEELWIRRVGAVGRRDVDVRVIAATHRDLGEAVRQGEFREDLYYRLSVIPIHLPPLRERGDDVLLLADHFLRTLASRYGLSAPTLDPPLQQILLSYHWPGNVRELRNSLERALLLGEEKLDPGDLFPATRPSAPRAGPLPFPAPMDEIERAAARSMLDRLSGNKKAAADALGISRSRLYRLLETGRADR